MWLVTRYATEEQLAIGPRTRVEAKSFRLRQLTSVVALPLEEVSYRAYCSRPAGRDRH